MVSEIAVWILGGALLHSIALLTVVGIATVRKDRDVPPFSDIDVWLRFLLRDGHDGQTILFRHRQSGRFIHFEKYADASGGGGIALVFPKIRWGKEYIERLHAYCESQELPYRTSAETETGTPDFIRVDLGNDVKKAFELSRAIWHDFFGYGEHDRQNRTVDDVLTVAELMAVPQRHLSRSEYYERFCCKTRARLKHVGLSWLGPFGFAGVFVIAGFSTVIMLVGLPVSTLLSLGDPSDWQVAVGPIQAQGSSSSLTFLFVYLVSYETLRRCMRFRLIDWQRWNHVENVVHRPKRWIFLAMPVAVILVWLGI